MSDLIERQAAIDALDSINCLGYVEEKWDIVRGIIELVPSAQPERKEGQWFFETLDGVPGYRPTVMFCSKCGLVSIADYSYCPHCGAKMRGEQE